MTILNPRWLLSFVLLFSAAALSAQQTEPQLKVLQAALEQGVPAEAAFKDWLGSSRLPLIGPDQVTFVWRAKTAGLKPRLLGSWQPEPTAMTEIGTSGVFYLSFPRTTVPDGSTYTILQSSNIRPDAGSVDPENPYLAYKKPLASQVLSPSWTGPVMIYRPKWKTAKADSPLPARDVFIRLPPGYLQAKTVKYPVLYMHDGQQIWDSEKAAWGGWKVDTAADRLAAAGKMPPVIIVGVSNSAFRQQEFLGWTYEWVKGIPQLEADEKNAEQKAQLHAEYARFLAEEVKPWVDAQYRTLADRTHTVLMGSSNGAAVTFSIMNRYPEVFGKAGLLSGNFVRPEKQLSGFKGRTDFRLWLDCGEKEVDAVFLPGNRALDERLQAAGYKPGPEYHFEFFPGALHNEMAWAKRLPAILEFLFQ